MPHINRIRVNNVKYNFGTQAYDDFLMKPFGHNTLYDLANGGGKSVLMLLMLQNMIPNCTLDDKQPIEKLFRTGDGSQTIHSLIEWKLDDPDVMNGFTYMTTGFCAKKAAQNVLEEEVRESASIEYFNYCIFYREYNENDIRNLPLVKEKERITYSGLKRYLKELEHDNSLMVYVFEKKREYQAFISRYGIYESEWEIIRGINKTEGHVRTYFESNYKTTRKVVEDLLIEEIIQKSFQLKSSEEDEEESMSKTLLDIREKLMELTKRKKELVNYDKQAELLTAFSARTEQLKRLYEEKEQQEESLKKAYCLAKSGQEEQAEALRKKEEEIHELEQTIESLTKKLEQGKVFLSRKEANLILAKVKEREQYQAEQKAAYEAIKEELNLKLCMNEYSEYLEEKQKRNEVMESIKAVSSNHTDLMEKISQYAYFIKHEIEADCQRLNAELTQLLEQIEEEEARIKQLSEKELSLLKEHAVSQNLLMTARRERDELTKLIAKKNAKVGILLIEEANQAKTRLNDSMQQLEEEIQKDADRIREYTKKSTECYVTLSKLEVEQKQAKEMEQLHKAFLQAYDKSREKAEKLLAAYGQKDYPALLKEIHLRFKKCIQTVADYRAEFEEKQNELERLNRGEFALDDTLQSKAKEYIKSRYDIPVLTGIEYLNSINDTERAALVHELPFLPYSLILERGYEQLRDNLHLSGQEFENAVIPVLYRRDLSKTHSQMSNARILLLSKDQSVLFDEKLLESEKVRLAVELEDLKKQIERFEDQERTFSEDEAYIRIFVTTEFARFQTETKALQEATLALEDLAAQILKCKEEQSQSEDAKKHLLQKQEDRRVLRAEYEEKNQILVELLAHDQELANKDQEVASQEAQTSQKKEQMDLAHSAVIELSHRLEEHQSQSQKKKERIHELELLWEGRYKIYYAEGSFDRPEGTLSDWMETMNGCLNVLESKYTDLEDKNRLMNSYVQAMNRCLKSIEAKQIAISFLEDLRKSERLHLTSEEELEKLSAARNAAQERFQEEVQKTDAKKAEWNRYDGKAEQTKASFEERFGPYIEESLDGVDFAAFTKDAMTLMQKNEAAIKEQTVSQEEIKQQLDSFDSIAKDIERLLRSADVLIPADQTKEADASITPLKLRAMFEALDKDYSRLQKELKMRCDEFQSNKQKTIESLRLIDAVGLADEMAVSVRLPENAADTIQLMKNFMDVNECLMLEKERITSGIADMQSIKDNFENQCLQRCIHIKTELERLPSLSRITLDGEQIPIISLVIPYVKEEFFKEKMSMYIDEIVAGADSFADSSERLRYIRNALSLKKLFSVIVTDMNGIKLSLYKRERIKEQSRHLRYEEAVGSTGQSQGIYIQFLIAIITYISNVNSKRIDSKGLRKVIFIDNPFGAAKDVYIWEPIFALLKANHVQLIVPARGTTPAITSRFDVNYILGQKLINNRQQTVVVDYHSSVDAEETEFAPLKYEQASFDFLS